MASNNSNKDRANNSPHSSSTRGPSKAQFHPQKILLNTISAAPSHQVHVNATNKEQSSAIASSSSASLSVSNVSEYDYVPKGYKLLDLNLPPPPETHQNSPSPVLHGCEKVQDCNLQRPEENNSYILQSESFENEMESNGALDNNLERAEMKEVGEREENKSDIRFGALLDAVECAIEEYKSDSDSKGNKGGEHSRPEERDESSGRKWRRVKWNTGGEEKEKVLVVVEEEEVSTSPVVKSNRGRTQVLPFKYRDSIIEPFTHLSSRHSRSSSNHGPTKRRPR